MIGWLGNAYLWVKAAHVAIVFFWIAGLFILPRHMVYQAMTAPGSAEEATWTTRIGMLKRIILAPSMILAWVLGLALAFNIGFAGNGWLHAKIAVVVLLTGYQGWASMTARRMSQGLRPVPERTLRILNELPALAVIVIAILVIVRPF